MCQKIPFSSDRLEARGTDMPAEPAVVARQERDSSGAVISGPDPNLKIAHNDAEIDDAPPDKESQRSIPAKLSDWTKCVIKSLWASPADWVTALSTLALVFYTAFLARYSAIQTKIQNNQLAKIDKTLTQTDQLILDANSQAKSSEIQAAEAVKSNSQNYNNSVVQLRPYISVTRFINANESELFPVRIEMKNGGQTPAINTVFRTRMMILGQEDVRRVLRNGLDNVRPAANEDCSLLIGSGNAIEAILNIDRLNTQTLAFEQINHFSKNEVSDYRENKKVLWISGVVYYNDVFTKLSRMRFCYIVESKTRNLNRCEANNDLTFYDGP